MIRYAMAFVFSCVLMSAPMAMADHHMHCTKDGKELAVKGKSDADKEKDCKGHGGSWEEKKQEASQSSGGGGGW